MGNLPTQALLVVQVGGDTKLHPKHADGTAAGSAKGRLISTSRIGSIDYEYLPLGTL
jgi:hypothetical protein